MKCNISPPSRHPRQQRVGYWVYALVSYFFFCMPSVLLSNDIMLEALQCPLTEAMQSRIFCIKVQFHRPSGSQTKISRIQSRRRFLRPFPLQGGGGGGGGGGRGAAGGGGGGGGAGGGGEK